MLSLSWIYMLALQSDHGQLESAKGGGRDGVAMIVPRRGGGALTSPPEAGTAAGARAR
jgi:hypothetical protein